MKDFLKKHFKLIIPILFGLAILLGLSQRKFSPELGYNTSTFRNLTKVETGNNDLKDYYRTSQGLSQQENRTAVTFLAAGDIMLSRNVAGTIHKKKDPLLPFRNMDAILKSTDFNFANLESPISGSSYFNPSGSMVFNAPTEYTKGLKEYNFQILNLANNHAFDQGLEGLLYTNQFLDQLGIKHTGTGNTLEEAWQPAVVETKGVKICFVGASYASVNDNGKTKNDYVARIEDVENLKLRIESSKSLCDFIVATMHAGTEYTRTPNDAQVDFAHAAINFGADMVIGAHPHWVQTTEKYNGKYIFYSLGNFIFDQEWSQDTKEGLALKVQVSKSQVQNRIAPGAASADDLQGGKIPAKLESIELIPVVIENYSTPRPATAEESKKILQKIGQNSTILN